jgi:hypothetical protein
MQQPPKHSPSPWECEDFTLFDATGGHIADLGFNLEDDDPCHYDAALIAEAPELLRALDWAMEALKRTTPEASRGDYFDSAEQTLKRARGDFL